MARSLRQYQCDDVERISRELRQRRNTLYVLPTGGGKTDVTSKLVSQAVHGKWRSLVLTHRWELMSQASQRLQMFNVDHGLIMPGRHLCADLAHVASIDTLDARLDEYHRYLDTVRFVVFDEAHHIIAPTWRRVRQALQHALRVGATATPYRTDGTGLGEAFDAVVTGPSVEELIAMGYLVRLRVYLPPLFLDLRKVPVRGGEWVPEELERVLDIPEVTLPAVQHYARLAGGQPAVVFCVTVAHAEHVAEQFRAAGYNAFSVDGTMSDGERDRRIRGLGRGVQVLTSAALIGEGMDVPELVVGVMLRPMKSGGLYQQQAGRPMRAAPGKSHGILLDMVGNTLLHGMPEEERRWDLAGGTPLHARTPVRKCPRCYRAAMHVAEIMACVECGAPLGRPAIVEHEKVAPAPISRRRVLSSLTDEEIRAGRFPTLMKMACSLRDLERIAQARSYSRRWVAIQARERGLRA